jgi:predicted MFS family arabinose efflux permease
VFAHAELRQVSLASFTYAGIQMCLASFLVVFLTERAGLSVTNAGFALSASMLGGIIGRIVWGIAADALGSARTVLGLIGIVMALSAFALSQVSVGWPFAAIVVLCIVFGTTALGWNGVYVAEVARIAPGGDVALATGASLEFTYLGVVVAPFAFWAIVAASTSYSIAYIVIGAITLIGAMTYFRRMAT